MNNWLETEVYLGQSILGSIKERLEEKLKRCGIMYRVFARCKTTHSLNSKITSHPNKYSKQGKKIQDILGFRIVFYFVSDVKPFCNALRNEEGYEDISDSEKEFKSQIDKCSKCVDNLNIRFDELFRPERLNLIFRMPEHITNNFREELTQIPEEIADLIDSTYEIQLRSVLSEGWHEVEHDLRYKCKEDWKACEAESRALNGIYGSLASHEYAMEMLFEKKARIHYLEKNWEAMLRNHLRIRITAGKLSENIKKLFDDDKNVAKPFLRCHRDQIIDILYHNPMKYTLSYDNLVFLINRIQEHPNDDIRSFEPQRIKEVLDKITSDKQK